MKLPFSSKMEDLDINPIMKNQLRRVRRHSGRRTITLLFVAISAITYGVYGDVTLTTLVSFNGTNGANPRAALVQDSDGYFYGTAYSGGQAFSGQTGTGYGTVFKMAPNGSLSVLLTNASNPTTPLLANPDGTFYFSARGGARYGAIVQVATNGAHSLLHSFADGSDGHFPNAVIWGTDGNLYGTTFGAFQSGDYGSLFSMTTNGTLTTLFTFGGARGYFPAAGLLEGADGFFYGTTQGYAAQGDYGGIFKADTNGNFTNMVTSPGYSPFANPESALIQGTDGGLYGTTSEGGDLTQNYGYGAGTIFRITTDGTLSIQASFIGMAPAYSITYRSSDPLVQGSDGNFYGATYSGGASNLGTVFQMTPAGVLTTLHSFTGGGDGSNPVGGLMQSTLDGNFYGTTMSGGTNKLGTVFRLSPPLAFQSVTLTGSVLTLTWGSVIGRTYQIQTSVDVTPGGWSNIGSSITCTNSGLTSVDVNATDPARFYRVALVQ
jgi:uncharacterized repeat protein (TIGR03803 family)